MNITPYWQISSLKSVVDMKKRFFNNLIVENKKKSSKNCCFNNTRCSLGLFRFNRIAIKSQIQTTS